MRAVATADQGEVNSDTLFEFMQEGQTVSARYAGGKIRLGYLVGTIVDGILAFRFSQVDETGRIDGGRSTCDISMTNEGTIRLLEHFQWESRQGSGVNVLEECHH